jgi:acyl carrier protein phosphodiesterase
MNFLAHLFLSCQNEELMIGNFIADFLKNRDVQNYSSGVQDGIRLHRGIDTYTDNHPIVLQGVRRLRANHSKYAPVVIDIYYDYLLANNFSLFSGQSLNEFTAQAYDVLLRNLDLMPGKLGQRLPYWIKDNWLMEYGKEEGLAFTCNRMKSRVSVPDMLNDAPMTLIKDLDIFRAEFITFFPDVQHFVAEQCRECE